MLVQRRVSVDYVKKSGFCRRRSCSPYIGAFGIASDNGKIEKR